MLCLVFSDPFQPSTDRTWKLLPVSVPSNQQGYIFIEGIWGNVRTLGDIAIDDVTVIDGQCPNTPPVVSAAIFPLETLGLSKRSTRVSAVSG